MINSDPSTRYSRDEQLDLFKAADQSIRAGLSGLPVFVPRPGCYSQALQLPTACFVTLKLFDELRGCIGSLETHQALIVDVADHAYAAAFRDHRFTPLLVPEYQDSSLEISILTSPERVYPDREQDLLRLLQVGYHGVVLQLGAKRATFLPAVWQQIADPTQFIKHLKKKAGIDPELWPKDIEVSLYTSVSFAMTSRTINQAAAQQSPPALTRW